MTLDEACERYQLSLDEFRGWERTVDAHGVEGLRLSQSQTHKNTR
jgi:hypothetical protein